MVKPCVNCKRVECPEECENKNCKLWQKWYIANWNAMRRETRLAREQLPKEPEGTYIGGVCYALPHRVRDYLHTDPCKGCLCPRDLCVIPCRVKRDWLTAWKLVQ